MHWFMTAPIDAGTDLTWYLSHDSNRKNDDLCSLYAAVVYFVSLLLPCEVYCVWYSV